MIGYALHSVCFIESDYYTQCEIIANYTKYTMLHNKQPCHYHQKLG